MNELCWYKDVCTRDSCINCIRYLEMQALMDSSCIPKHRQHPATLTPDNCDYASFCYLADVKDDIQTFVRLGKSLYLYSDKTGNGKTSWAIKLMLKYFDCVWAGNGFKCRGLFISVPKFLAQAKDFSHSDPEFEHIKRTVATADLVIWDDIASTDLSAYDHSQLLCYIDQRVLAGKSNIFTGNRKGEQLEKAVGTRLASRIWNESAVVEFKGKDKR